MEPPLPIAQQRVLQTPHGPALGTSYAWPGGQYCAIHTANGLVGCGIYDIRSANEFNLVFDNCTGQNKNHKALWLLFFIACFQESQCGLPRKRTHQEQL